LASLVGRVWATPTAAIVLGAAAGYLATQFDDSVQGAVVGLVVGVVVSIALTWRMSRWAIRAALALGGSAFFGALVGSGIGGCVLSGGPMGYIRAMGVAFSSWLIILAFRTPESTRKERWSKRLAFASGLAAGGLWLSGPLREVFAK
jgi:hypothetical protein